MKIRNSLVVCLTTLVVTAFSGTAHAADGTVPDCVGLELAKAQSMLESAGFQVTIEPAPGRTIGLVFSQVPGGFALASKGSAVTLHVGGPTPKPGPSVEPAAPRDPAPREPAPREPAPREPAPRDPDGGQEGPISTPEDLGAPPAGAGAVPVDPGVRLPPVQPRVPTETPTMRAATGSTALVYQGRAIPPGTLPNVNGPELPGVIGRSVQQATAALRPWNVLVEYMLAMPEFVGQVINQVPYAGTTLAQGQNVTIVVAIAKSKPDATFVPQAQGKEWTDACESTTRAGLVPVPRSVVSMASERGKVLLQSPQSGSLVAPGSQVTLLVGRGPGAYSAEVEDSGSAEPAPVEPLPAGPTPPEPADPDPRGPTPLDPTDDAPPAGTGTAPIEPEPRPVEPGPVGPRPVEPRPVEPTPAAPEPVPAQEPKPSATLAAPTLSSPPAGESYPYKYGADFSWSAVDGATSYELELQEEQPSGAWATVETFTVSAPQHRPAKLKRGRYRWRTRALGTDGAEGRWSDYRRLYMY